MSGAWYFKDGVFFPNKCTVTKTKIFTTLPNFARFQLSAPYIYKVAKVVPISMLASYVQEIPFTFDFQHELAFFDIETDKSGKVFKLGNINGQTFYDADNMIRNLHNYKVRIAYNMYRFDNPVLFSNSKNPTEFMGTYDLRKFVIHYIKDGINLDMLFFARLYPFNTLRLYQIARQLDLHFTDTTEFNEEFGTQRCTQDVELLTQIFWMLKIPDLCKVLNELVSMDLHILQNVFFDRFLRYLMLNQYLTEGYLPVEYPKNSMLIDSKIDNILKLATAGEYTKVWYYDVQNAYPNTAISLGTSVYFGEKVLPHLLEKIMRYVNAYEGIRAPLKKIANALIGYMNDKNNFFSNPTIWYNVVHQFNDIMLEVTHKVPLIWANTDGFMTQKQVNLSMPNYSLILKEYFKYIKIFHVNKYIGVDAESKVHMKGFSDLKLDALMIIEKRFKEQLVQCLDIQKALKAINTKDVLNNQALWRITIRKTSDTCRNLDYLEYWEDLQDGFNDIYLKPKERKEKLNEWQRQFY